MPLTLSQLLLLAAVLCLLGAPAALPAQETTEAPVSPEQPAIVPVTVFPHSETTRWLLSGQANIIFQSHTPFHSPYEGINSFVGRGEYKTSLIGTLFMGYQLNQSPRFSTDLLLNVESAGGRGLSQALGLAGFSNLDVVRNPTLGSKPYVARVQLHQVLGLTSTLRQGSRTPFSLSPELPARRIDLRVGRMSLPDVFDLNGPGSDSHLQFMNWTADNDGAYDYAADTRGYTYAAVAEYDDLDWSARAAVALMPTVANGIDLDWNLRRARGENFELEYRKLPLTRLLAHLGQPERAGALRLTGFANWGNMGVYRTANRDALSRRQNGNPAAIPDITAHAPAPTVKYGIGLNFEQALTADIRAFGRFGWNEGAHESYCYTEVDQTFEVGGDMAGPRWSRPYDRFGVVGITNAIKRDHQAYLALGGRGFLLGDGALTYAREDILETYYTAHTWRGLFTAFDLQLVAHPGYNLDRGPVPIFSVRTHVDF